ncbi:exonuclease subunit SbcC [Lusitaniella coriacea]|uniref:exonuclease subunit SbcC n=1 Tax=Lusitaniella coriacea TaxID=1983105 RepID=UPI003CF8AB7B
MIPLQLTLKNFLSYREATLDFRGLHTACICGSNGAGKSSLLEAIAWAIWGQSRTATEDDVINAGEMDVRVDFTFINNYQTYRIIRSRHRGRSPGLEFQVETESGSFRSLSGKNVRTTQHKIITDLRLDYDTFINSAYLRQGRADEFMLRRPNERKQILADLLKLDRYEELAEKAKDTTKQFKGQTEQLTVNLQRLKEQLEQREDIVREGEHLKEKLEQLHKEQTVESKQLKGFQALDGERQTWQQQFLWQKEECERLGKECDRVLQDRQRQKTELHELQELCDRETEIISGYQGLLQLQQEEENLATKFQAYQEAQQQKQQLQQQLERKRNELNLQLRQTQTRLEALEQQDRELVELFQRGEEIDRAIAQLKEHRQQLDRLDSLQHEVSPLLQRRGEIALEVERTQTRLSARLEQLRASEREFSAQTARFSDLRQTVWEVNAKVEELDKKKVYRDRVQEKGQEQRAAQERLQENQRTYEKRIKELQQKLELLEVPEAICPLCERPLDEHYRGAVVDKTQQEQENIQQQFWLLREQMAEGDRKLQALRAEYAQITQELEPYDSLLQQRGQVETDLDRTYQFHERLQENQAEQESLRRSLEEGNYALELQTELQNLDRELQRLNYDEQTHALVREEVKRWRWAEIKQAKLEDARQKHEQIAAQKPQLETAIAQLQTQLEGLGSNSELQQQILQVEGYLRELGYNRDRHNAAIAELRQAQSWQLRHQQLQRAQQELPKVQNRLQGLEERLEKEQKDKRAIEERLAQLQEQMVQMPDHSAEIHRLEVNIQQRRRQMDELLANQGRQQQQLAQLETTQQQKEDTQQQLDTIRRKHRVYQELAQAFGKNGLQALMIENVLPQLEAETNQILGRLTGNQLHVQFLTQRTGKSSRSKKKNAKLIDTLDILIADVRGTRPYETYSGGEAFRINFSIRLALAKLLAQRAGTSVQMLIIDEGFGTQDREGCDRLIAAINAIASDFKCILAVTHMPQFKEAFQHRIEVIKTDSGSQLTLLD